MTHLEIADRIGGQLCRDALWAGDRCNWIGCLRYAGDIAWGALGADIYAGTAGIALFLQALFVETGEPIHGAVARAALRNAVARSEELAPAGFYTGRAGLAWVCDRFDEPALELARGGSADFDVTSGLAGAIPVLLRLYQRHGCEWMLANAMAHGEALCAAAIRSDAGWAWDTAPDVAKTQPLTGFAHGASGIAWGLLELAQVSGERKFQHAADEGFRYERSSFDAATGNWPDFRLPGRPGAAMWCHGSGGIGLTRVRAWQVLGIGHYRTEAEAAARASVAGCRQPSQWNFSLCHGHSGNGMFLLYAGAALSNPEYTAAAEAVAKAGARLYGRERLSWPCGIEGAGEVLGLMEGIAGIGLFYLQTRRPATAPSILLPISIERNALQ